MLQGEIPIAGSFANFPAKSFAHNVGLCGAPWLNVPQCKTRIKTKSRSDLVHLLKYILPPILLVIFVSLVACIWVIVYKRNQRLPSETESSLVSWKRFSHYDLKRATESSESNLLGTGGFASVFKGTLSDGTTAAVKVFNMQFEEAIKSFDCESEVLVKIRHRNLLKIISSCTNFEVRALVLEYMPNRSLDKWLHLHDYCLDISQRINVMIDVANALEYLYYGQGTTIVHCDLKPSNVLLDEDMIAHGVVLMETFTRKKPTDEMFSGKMNLRSWVKKNLHCSFLKVVDNKLIETDVEYTYAEEQCVTSILDLALDCSVDSAAERITMKEALNRLEQIK